MRTLLALAALLLLPVNLSALEIAVDARISYLDGLVISGLTNLPEATRVLVVVYSDSAGYYLESEAVVKDGAFRSGPFGPSLAPGTYTSEIMTVPAQFQPDSVQQVIGARGERLRGGQVTRGMLGGRVYLRTQFTLL